jgi:predicted Zn-dependent peptidase
MGRIGASLLLHGEVLDIDTITARVDAVTLDEVAELAARIFAGPRTLAAVGPFSSDDFDVATFGAP